MKERNLYTAVPTADFLKPLAHREKVLLLGSCFSQNIGTRLQRAGFHALINPFGITFNPISIASSINRALSKNKMSSSELDSRNDIFFHYDFHSSFSGVNRESVLNKMNESIDEAENYLVNSHHLIMTLGTAWVYRLEENDAVVNNCHKKPREFFAKELLSVEEIVKALNDAILGVKQVNPDLNVLFTLSPVRHWKDGAIENSVSKATLRRAIYELNETEGYDYFPAYEILMDELRDYRYYSDDLLHPSKIAQDIIWKRFLDVACSEDTLEIIRKVQRYWAMEAHRSMHPHSEEARKFSLKLAEEKKSLEKSFPFIQLDGTK
ncbi:MAG: GSCFA domain-containing protein [Flavobacteriales bacterium]|nr:GSCFA domain-containing protein [Flavobacteriales bacterium]